VDEIITLAEMYNALGRSREARDTLQRMSGKDASSYGVMQFELDNVEAQRC
jgi:hypothetical protein